MTTFFEIDDEKWVKVKILLESHNNLIDRIDKLEKYVTETEMIMTVIKNHISLREKLDKLEKSKDNMEKNIIFCLEKMKKLEDLKELEEEKTDNDIVTFAMF